LQVGYVLPLIDGASDQEKGLLSSMVFAGMLLGGLVAGHYGDKRGRRTTLLAMLALNGIFGCLTALAPTMLLICLCRFCCGLGVGGAVPCVFSLMAELSTRESRGYHISIICAFWYLAQTFLA
jgi:MFS family permease